MIKGIAHVCLAACDLRETERFYCEGLGFAKAFDFIRNGEIFGFYLRSPGGSFVEVFRQDGMPSGENCAIRHLCLEDDNLEELAAHLARLGYSCTERKMGADHSWQMWITDPSGVKIEFHQYTPESSQLTGADCILP